MSSAAQEEMALAVALSLSMEEAKRAEPVVFPNLRKVTLPSGDEGITLEGRRGSWTEGECIKAGVQHSQGRCVCIRMTVGSFRGYTDTALLHTGVSDSAGVVFNFDEAGHHQDAWVESINFHVAMPREAWTDRAWDAALATYDAHHRRAGPRYRAVGNNCYNYITGFMNHIKYLGRADHTVESLATILEPAILPAVKYVRLFQKLQSQPVVVRAAGHKVVSHWSHPHKLFRNTEGTLHSCDVCGARVRMCHTCHHGCDFDVCDTCMAVPAK